jgi:hypothetical protein
MKAPSLKFNNMLITQSNISDDEETWFLDRYVQNLGSGNINWKNVNHFIATFNQETSFNLSMIDDVAALKYILYRRDIDNSWKKERKYHCNVCGKDGYTQAHCEICVRQCLADDLCTWSSQDQYLDQLIQEIQSRAPIPRLIIEWVPFSNFQNTQQYKGQILRTTWKSGYVTSFDRRNKQLVRNAEWKCLLKPIKEEFIREDRVSTKLCTTERHSSNNFLFSLVSDLLRPAFTWVSIGCLSWGYQR